MPVTISYGCQIVDWENLNAKSVFINKLFWVKRNYFVSMVFM